MGLVAAVSSLGEATGAFVVRDVVLERTLLPLALVKVGVRMTLGAPALLNLLCMGLSKFDVDEASLPVVAGLSLEVDIGGLGDGALICSINSGGGSNDSADLEASRIEV